MNDFKSDSGWLLGEKFDQIHTHHQSLSELWWHKWSVPCARGLYPFHDGKYEDFEEVFKDLLQRDSNETIKDFSKEFYRSAQPVIDDLVMRADRARADENRDRAIHLYLRACAMLRIARFPYVDKENLHLFQEQKAIYMRASTLFDCPIEERLLHHHEAVTGTQELIPIYVRIPKSASAKRPCPVVLLMCGLDGHRPDNTERSNEFLARGWASVIVDIPGTADCPCDRRDPESPDALWTSILDWIARTEQFDAKRVICWGLSAGGYYAVRAAHTHATYLAGAVAQGAGLHHFFSREWLEKARYHEYPFDLLPPLTKKFGYDSEEQMLENIQQDYSLVESGVVRRPSCRLLLVNGTEDGIMPIEDSMLMFLYGSAKEARFFEGKPHMGYPSANASIYPWMEEIMKTGRRG